MNIEDLPEAIRRNCSITITHTDVFGLVASTIEEINREQPPEVVVLQTWTKDLGVLITRHHVDFPLGDSGISIQFTLFFGYNKTSNRLYILKNRT